MKFRTEWENLATKTMHSLEIVAENHSEMRDLAKFYLELRARGQAVLTIHQQSDFNRKKKWEKPKP
jgi:hypothetical protein